MAEEKKRYWIYSHDADSNLVGDIGEEEFLVDALDKVADYITTHDESLIASVTIRVVEDGKTVWMAGPSSARTE